MERRWATNGVSLASTSRTIPPPMLVSLPFSVAIGG